MAKKQQPVKVVAVAAKPQTTVKAPAKKIIAKKETVKKVSDLPISETGKKLKEVKFIVYEKGVALAECVDLSVIELRSISKIVNNFLTEAALKEVVSIFGKMSSPVSSKSSAKKSPTKKAVAKKAPVKKVTKK